jgi:Tfp pilus assembly protein PilE
MMKKNFKSIAGVTLLEIMLVLAIAAMVIVMSIRYYQNAQNGENSNVIMEMVQNITAAADNISVNGGGYSGMTTSTISAIAGTNNMLTPYGGKVTISGANGGSYVVTMGAVPYAVCSVLVARLGNSPKYSGLPTCTKATSTVFLYTYINASG